MVGYRILFYPDAAASVARTLLSAKSGEYLYESDRKHSASGGQCIVSHKAGTVCNEFWKAG
jgi:hypothetical protein